MFRTVVFSVLVSGLAAFVLTAGDLRKLESTKQKLARKILGPITRRVRDDNGIVRHHALPNAEVNKKVNISRVETELRVARLKWMQEIMREPLHHNQHVTALFGHFPFESKPLQRRADGFTHDWAKQWCSYLASLSDIDDVAWVAEEYAGKPIEFFKDEQAIQDFRAFDMNLIRARETSNSPAPGVLPPTRPPPRFGTRATRISVSDDHFVG